MKKAVGIATCLCVLAGSASAQTYSDDFNRPDGPIGGDWVAGAGTFSSFIVENNRGGSTGGNLLTTVNSVASFSNYADTKFSLDVHVNTTSLEYVAIMIGLGGSSNLFIKVQQQGGIGFGNIGFYGGNNASGLYPGGAGFIATTAPFFDARMTISFSDPDTLVLDIDTDFNGTPDQTYTSGAVTGIAGGFGTQVGIGTFGPCRFDNFFVDAGGGGCYPDCDGSGGLDFFDFLCFQNEFAAGTTYGDCDGSGSHDFFDFLCFQNKFAAGCP